MSKNLIFYKKAKNSILPDNLDWFLTRCDSSNYSAKETIKLPGYLVVDMDDEVQYYGIYNKAFYGEDNIKELHIPKTISYIGASAFGRSSIEKIYFYSVAPRMDLSKDVFEGMDLTQLQILVPSGTKSNYYIQSWIDACGGEDNWNTIVQEGNHFSDEEIRPLHLYGRSDIESFNATDTVIDSMGQMAFLGTNFTNEQANNKGIELSEDSLVTYNATNKTVFYDKALYRSMPDTTNILNNATAPNMLKPNSLYKNTGLFTGDGEVKTLYINTPQIEDFAFQNANEGQPFNLEIGPDVNYISPYAFIGCQIQEARLAQADTDSLYTITDENVLNQNTVTIIYREYVDNLGLDGDHTYEPIGPGTGQYFMEYEYLRNQQNELVPVLYLYEEGVDIAKDSYFYDGIGAIDGKQYDRWQKIETLDSASDPWKLNTKTFVYTERIVETKAKFWIKHIEYSASAEAPVATLLGSTSTGELILLAKEPGCIISTELLANRLALGFGQHIPTYIPAHFFENCVFSQDLLVVPMNISEIGRDSFFGCKVHSTDQPLEILPMSLLTR